LEWPRKAFMPPPATPVLPSSSYTIAIVPMFCEPFECCVQPNAYMLVIAWSAAEVSAIHCQASSSLPLREPQILSTHFRVYRA
jgi:hypothetical protein